ncbi:hypothetical protein GCM10010256_76260 [Streptomyces coeruleorubidus]|uniref:Uncharacterized protein n=1 Tax=Streptomyces coeruleorubidus TaxID=116188 RepID=A0A5J6I8I4_STRC4|nr:hypothetical protein CP976_29770 [Streptomyces coeruleorubidus]GGU05038.1 hypothetical protein GCM10010256_76260 [Streptomyces coeruleorubidus]
MPAGPPRTEERAGRLTALLGERARQDPDFAAVPEIRRRRADTEGASPSGDVRRGGRTWLSRRPCARLPPPAPGAVPG